MNLKEKILKKKAKIGILGLGYVGLPLAIEFSSAGFKVTGLDSDKERVANLKNRRSYILDIADEQLKKANIDVTADFECLKKLDVCIICVPTPLRKTKDPDISYIVKALNTIVKHLHKEQLIVLESTTYPGTTEELIFPRLAASGLKCGEDFYLAFSPERIDPGNAKFHTANIPKVVGGIDEESTRMAALLYKTIVSKVIPVSSSMVAELVKLLENTYRIVNIGLINEFAMLCNKLGVDVWEVIEAAKTKPFGFTAFYPGPGTGGHCIPADPLYLSWKAREYGFEAKFIQLASEINSHMPGFVVEKISLALNEKARAVKGSKILILGIAYKKDVKDLRESPAIEIIEKLKKIGAEVSYHDPYLPYLKIHKLNMKSENINKSVLTGKDCVAIITDHSIVDYASVLKHASLIVDTRNALKDPSEKVIRL